MTKAEEHAICFSCQIPICMENSNRCGIRIKRKEEYQAAKVKRQKKPTAKART